MLQARIDRNSPSEEYGDAKNGRRKDCFRVCFVLLTSQSTGVAKLHRS